MRYKMSRKKKATPLVCIVVEDDADRERIDGLLRATGYRTSVFDSGEAFLRSYHDERIDCLILEEHLPGLSGLRLQCLLADAHIAIPIVFVTARINAARTQALAKDAGADPIAWTVSLTPSIDALRVLFFLKEVRREPAQPASAPL
jgi:FixJ family two-component response regulator